MEHRGGGSRDLAPWCSWEPPCCGVTPTLCEGCATSTSTLSGETEDALVVFLVGEYNTKNQIFGDTSLLSSKIDFCHRKSPLDRKPQLLASSLKPRHNHYFNDGLHFFVKVKPIFNDEH